MFPSLKTCAVALFIAVGVSTTAADRVFAFTAEDAKQCVRTGLEKVKSGASLAQMIDEYLGINGLTALVASRLGIDPANIPQDSALRIRKAADAYLKKKIAKEKSEREAESPNKVPGHINPHSVIIGRYAKPVGNAYVVAGRYKTFAKVPETYDLMVAEGCFIWDSSWQNVRLSDVIAARLR